MRPFRPLAVVGQACVLPGASSPAALWDIVSSSRSVVRDVPHGRFRVDAARVAGAPGSCVDRTYSTRGGYVTEGPPSALATTDGLDPLFHWVKDVGRACLVDAGFDAPVRGVRAGAVLGNLSFPTEGMTLFGEQRALDAATRARLGAPWSLDVDPKNRFMSGLPAHLLAEALHLDAGAFALDAACASSLYALRLAALALDDGRADLMLAGAVNRADSLFLHVGFCALQALSPSGVPRPFDRRADGLVPAEGCGFVALMRLEDALAQRRRVHAVIRGVGLRNDGRGKNLLAPSSDGQVRAIRAAWASAGLDPSTADYVECHATGTPMGDRVEVMSVAEAFRGAASTRPLPVGSLKGNLGHLITAAGVAGLIKVIEALRREELPPSVNAEEPLDVLDGRLGLRVQQARAPWAACDGRPRRAGVSAFGFGGNNAHVVVEEHRPERIAIQVPPARPEAGARSEAGGLAVVAAGVRRGAVRTLAGLAAAAAHARAVDGHDVAARTVDVDLDGVRFPPNDLRDALAQQLLAFEAARDAAAGAAALFEDRERVGIFIGMGADVRVTTPGLRWRAPEIARRLAPDLAAGAASFIEALRDSAMPPLGAQGVLGSMPNIPANRLNVQLDVRGPGFTVSAEEHSGLAALDVAAGLIDAGDIDAALVGAVDACDDPRHEAALAALRDSGRGAAGAVVLALTSVARARALDLPVLAVIDASPRAAHGLAGDGAGAGVVDARASRAWLGDTHAASGLFAVAEAVARVAAGVHPEGDGPWLAADRTVRVDVDALSAPRRTLVVTHGGAALSPTPAPLILTVAAADRASLIAALAPSSTPVAGAGRWRAAVVARSAEELTARRAALAQALATSARVDLDGAWAREAEARGPEAIALLCGTAGGVAPGTGLELLRAFPDVTASLAGDVDAAVLEGVLAGTRHAPGCLANLAMASAAMQISARALREVLGVGVGHTLGISLGESNAFFASGVWRDLGAMLMDMERSRLFDEILFGPSPEGAPGFEAARAHWAHLGRAGRGPVADLAAKLADDPWRAVVVRAPVDAVRAACADTGGLCFVLVVHTDDEVEIGGAPAAVDGVSRALGVTGAPMPRMPAVHCPLIGPARDAYRALHRRRVSESGVRTWSHGVDGELTCSDDDACADAVLAQASRAVDFPALVRRVIDAGVRVIVDVSPRGLAGTWAARTAGARADVVSVDGTLASLAAAAARLHVAGVDVDVTRLAALAERPAPARVLRVPPPALPGPLPPAPVVIERMTRPPRLPPVLPQGASLAVPLPLALPASELPAPRGADAGDVGAPSSDAAAFFADNRRRALAAHEELLASMARGHQAFLAHREALTRRAVALADVDAIDAGLAGTVVDGGVIGDEATAPLEVATRARAQRALWGRADLERLASGRIADVWGETFAVQDGFRRQVRMPEPPLLLADRVMRIDASPGVLEKNRSIVTETDVTAEAWYLHEGRCPAGVLIETGQADLLLVSYMGVDFENRGERVYRLLGCDLTYHAPLPLAGTTLEHDIHVDGYATHGDVRIFFFHSDTYGIDEGGRKQLLLSVREGQAGFFTDQELARSGGVLWSPPAPRPPPELSAPLPQPTRKRALSREELVAFSEGDAAACFGPGFEMARTQVRPPRIPAGPLLLIDRVTDLDLEGGYVRAELDLEDRWFFAGHFKDDPCMPGTIMFEGCLEVLAVALAGGGYTLSRDGFRFEPAVDKAFELRCRGQAVPSSRTLVYEAFIKRITDGPEPAVVADVLVTVDGLKSLHCESVEVKLSVDWPLSSARGFSGRDGVSPRTTHALLATGTGRPSEAFPELYAGLDDGRRVPRLPGPPYHFMSRVVDTGGPAAGALLRGEDPAGAYAVVEYDVPPGAWYFDDTSPFAGGAMPFAVFLEVALQPCGWVSSVVGSALTAGDDLYYRNLDGTSRLHRTVGRDAGTLVTRATLLKSSSSGGMIIQELSFAVTTADGAPVYDGTTVFGFFPQAALARQVGVGGAGDVERARLAERCAGFDVVDAGFAGPLRMVDRVTGYWPGASRTGRGRVRTEKDVDAGEWFFKAHFFQDPVQPGSLGVEAMVQALQWLAVHEGHHRGMRRPRFEPLAVGEPAVWKYRGQVTPRSKLVQVELDLVDVEAEAGAVLLRADAVLWVDGTPIYRVEGLAVRLADLDTTLER